MICPDELVALVTAIAISLSKGLTIDQLNIFSAIFVQLGDTLDTIATQKTNIQNEISKCKKKYDDETNKYENKNYRYNKNCDYNENKNYRFNENGNKDYE